MLSVASAVVHVALLGVVAFFAFGLGSAPFENQSPESEAVQHWLLVLSPVLAVLAIAFGLAAAARSVKWMAAAWLAEFVLVAGALFAALERDPDGDYNAIVAGALVLLASGGVATATVREEKP